MFGHRPTNSGDPCGSSRSPWSSTMQTWSPAVWSGVLCRFLMFWLVQSLDGVLQMWIIVLAFNRWRKRWIVHLKQLEYEPSVSKQKVRVWQGMTGFYSEPGLSSSPSSSAETAWLFWAGVNARMKQSVQFMLSHPLAEKIDFKSSDGRDWSSSGLRHHSTTNSSSLWCLQNRCALVTDGNARAEQVKK